MDYPTLFDPMNGVQTIQNTMYSFRKRNTSLLWLAQTTPVLIRLYFGSIPETSAQILTTPHYALILDQYSAIDLSDVQGFCPDSACQVCFGDYDVWGRKGGYRPL